MGLASRKSAQFGVLMLRDDELALDAEIEAAELGAVWESRGPGRWQPTYHASLLDALDAGGGTQAFLRLADGEGGTGPIFQYLRGTSLPGGDEDTLRAGRVAYMWLPATEDPAVGTAFQALADAGFAAARRVTLPHVVTPEGKPRSGYRIGRAAEAWYLESPWPRRKLCDMSTLVTYRLRSELQG